MLMRLFRTLQKKELEDLRSRKAFRLAPNSIEGKSFWTTREDAERFARLLLTRYRIEPSWIVEVHVEAAVLERLAAVPIDGRPARVVYEDDLDWFNEKIMDLVIPSADA